MSSHIRVILARPQEPRNIGAACRAAKNFGIEKVDVVLRGVFDREAAWPMSIGAGDVFERITRYETLADAVADASLVVGATRRLGQRRKESAWQPWEFARRAALLAPAEVALVFGNERSGLDDEELMECSAAVAIPTSPGCPSMNLSHAVSLLCYEISLAQAGVDRSGPSGRTPGGEGALTRSELGGLVREMLLQINQAGIPTQEGPQGMGSFLTDVLGRAAVNGFEANRLLKIVQALAWKRPEPDPRPEA
ncbi:MAG: RNA methyltransferase [Spirochaetales bacterium]